jgi:endonuclease/exonuclease/phosphatase family metal-dependent hydrolase
MSKVTRRVLTVFMPLLLCLSPGREPGAAPVDLTVMTQNTYVGADAGPVLSNPSPDTIAAAFQSVIANNFPARAGAIAREAAGAGGPLLIGLQEAAIISAPSGTLDYAQILVNQLAAQGLQYSIAGVHTGFQIASAGFGLTDREVVLARTDIADFAVTGSEAHTFANDVILPTPLGPFPLERGYVLVDATLDGVPFEFVSTHLDETHSSAQPLEAGEILARLGMTTEPELVVGDFNARPTEPTYAEMLTAGFTDVALFVGAVGPTCCQSSDLDNPASQLSNRFDYVFERGFLSIDAALLVGNTVFENVRPLWPSDHAGVIGTVDVPEPSAAALFVSAIFLLGTLKLRNDRSWGDASVVRAMTSRRSRITRLAISRRCRLKGRAKNPRRQKGDLDTKIAAIARAIITSGPGPLSEHIARPLPGGCCESSSWEAAPRFPSSNPGNHERVSLR